MGNSDVREKLIQGLSIPEIINVYESQLEHFVETRKHFLLY
jgi:uncharacterized protein YbbC (DUF1343 family)